MFLTSVPNQFLMCILTHLYMYTVEGDDISEDEEMETVDANTLTSKFKEGYYVYSTHTSKYSTPQLTQGSRFQRKTSCLGWNSNHNTMFH